MQHFFLTGQDALIVVDVQNDFLPGGRLAVPHGDEVVPVLNRYLEVFARQGCAIFATRDWHPVAHCSFQQQGGPWPPHCLADSPGAGFAPGLQLPSETVVISKATRPQADAYSGFEGTNLATLLCGAGVARVFVGGLATDYCVRRTVEDALRGSWETVLLLDAVRAVERQPGDGRRAIRAMLRAGAQACRLHQLQPPGLRMPPGMEGHPAAGPAACTPTN